MSTTPKTRKMPPRPKLILPVGQYGDYPQTPIGFVATPFSQTPMPMTPGSGQTNIIFNKKKSFMLTQFRGIKDFTKAGLSVGEKSAFWFYEKVINLLQVITKK